ncbi:hypothetical protein ACFQ6Q_18370 [Streptomyces sp. NPDC056437]|uniref:hypothetical protein n=1 Tax=Streptomyces sp. NPDC056437 TaxID=3345816 RepID=UPI0036A98A5A
MDAVVDAIEARWQGPAAKDAVRIRELMKLIEAAVRMSRNGFTELELDKLAAFKQIQVSVNVDKEADELSTPNTATGPGAPTASRLLGL